MTATQEDEGFEALLKPIQDLTRNWDVNLCLHLEEYIHYIRQICGDNLPDMNFAQAAVLVQNSANIYSKKVDLLFTTVLKLLDTLSKKQNDGKNKENGSTEEEGGGHAGGKRRKAAAIFDTQEFLGWEDVCSDRLLTLNLEKERQKISERKKPNIVLNAAIKVKAKEKTSCNIYNCAQDIMGKKEEFRLNWRICSAGTLHEEFVINSSKFKILEPVEIPVPPDDVPPADDSHHDYDDHCSNHSGDAGPPASPLGEAPLPLDTALFPIPPDRESEDRGLGEARKDAGKKVKTVDTKEVEWQANDFNNQLPEKPIKKRKVVKIPPGLDDEKKRKSFEDNFIYSSYTVTDVLFDKYKDVSFNRDLDFGYQAKQAARLKRQMLIQHRSKYQAYQEREAGIEQNDDFHGFYNEEQDSDNEHDFEGFGDAHDYDNSADVDIPLPDKENILELNNREGWKGDELNTYDNEAMRTMQAFRSRKIDHGKMSDMARRVEEWHQKILPKLEAAEERSSFDIHGYGSKVLDAFQGQIGSEKSFEEIVIGQPREEVARYFLATLVLANQYNVEISESEPGDLNVDCVQLKLLSEVRHHEELDDNLRQTSDKGDS